MKTLVKIVIILFFLFSVSAFAEYSGGSGTEADPWQISCPNDLLYLGSHPEHYNANFILTADIDLSGYTFTTAVIAPDINNMKWDFQGTVFTGTFDGNGYVISNLTIDSNGSRNFYLGLFGNTGTGCEIKNLGIEDVNINGLYQSQAIGGLVGENYGNLDNCYTTGYVCGGSFVGGLCGSNGEWNNPGSIISDCFSTCSVICVQYYSEFIGGLCGDNSRGVIQDCFSTGPVSGGGYIGGLCGYNSGGIINDCFSSSPVTGVDYIGGLIGLNYSANSIRNCYATGDVNGKIILGGLIGENIGQIGKNYGTVRECYATGSIKGRDNSREQGGLVGRNSGVIINCYATGAVIGENNSKTLGGLVGYNGNTIIICYSTGEVKAGTNSGALGGFVGANSGGIGYCLWDKQTSGMQVGVGSGYRGYILGKITAQMQTQSTFTNYYGDSIYRWDFVGETANGTEDIWFVREGKEYPKLWWQNNRPVANAGADQTVYAWIDGLADVNLDGSASFDEDGDEISYHWTWSIDGNNFDANGINPTIQLPVGEHKITLVVSDFLNESEPNDVNITVIEPMEAQMLIVPRVINLKSKMPRIIVMMWLPEGITADDVNSNYRLMLYPDWPQKVNPIEAFYQNIYQYKVRRFERTGILALFEKPDLASGIREGRDVEFMAVGKLKTGQYFFGSDTIKIIDPPGPKLRK